MDTIHISQESASPPSESGVRRMATRVLITGMAVFLAMAIVPGITVDSISAGLAAAIILTVLNLLARPILLVLAFPLILLSLGLFIVVINALLLEFTAFLVQGFSVDGFWSAMGGAVVISLVSLVLQFLTGEPRRIDIHASRTQIPRPPKIINPDE